MFKLFGFRMGDMSHGLQSILKKYRNPQDGATMPNINAALVSPAELFPPPSSLLLRLQLRNPTRDRPS